MDDNHRIKLCNTALQLSEGVISAEDYLQVSDYIKHDEWGIGIEHLIYTFIENELDISKEQYEAIHVAMKSMELGEEVSLGELRKCIK